MAQKILITGTSRGLGLALARKLLETGNAVWGCSRGDSPLEREFPEAYHHRQIDLADDQTGRQAFKALLKDVDGFGLVILNAGILPAIRDMKDTDLETLRNVMEINVWANKWILDIVLDLPVKPAQVVAISSGAAVSGSRGWNAYSISKAGLNMLVKLYAAEEPDVHFTALAPGLVDTAMQDYISSIEEDAEFETVQRLKEAKNTPDMPSPKEAADSILGVLDELKASDNGAFLDIRKM